MRTFFLSFVSMLAFAGNSVLCRLALADREIDPSSFTAIRLVSGALMLLFLLSISPQKDLDSRPKGNTHRSIFAAASLFSYALFFSYAYLSLDTATGALVLFGVVQITMVAIGIVRGRTLQALEWLGLVLACSGFVYLLLPELSHGATLNGLIMMAIAGFSWAVYTILGQGSVQPLVDTKTNFIFSIPMVFLFVLVCVVFDVMPNVTPTGVLLALASGAITSGVGYAIWYAVLPKLATTVAAVIQLTVPVIAAILGLLLVKEVPSIHLLVSGAIILMGILLVIMAGRKPS